MRRFQRIIEPIDDYLSSIGLYRKITAKDGSCLFRAVAEQVFHTQAHHLKVRDACVKYMENNRDRFAPFIEGPFDQHLVKLKDPKEWAGQVEISALSLMYKRDFFVYQEPGIGAFNVTQNGFTDKIVLCFSHGSHYDSVFSKKFQENAAICQSIIYEILYKDVFKLSKQVDEAVDILRSSNKKPMRRDGHYGPDGMRDGRSMDGDHMGMDRDGRDRFGRYHEEKKRPPLPYRVAKALDPEIYRNVEFDAWNEARKEQQHQDYLVASVLQYAPGDKCQVFLDDPKKLYNAHIQDVQPNNGPVTVFIEDLGEKHTVPMKNLKPVESLSPRRPWSPLGGRNYKNLNGYFQKYANGVNNESGYNQPCHQQQQLQQHPPFVHPLMQQDRQHPRSTSPYQRGRGGGRCNHTMHNAMSQEEYDEKRALEESLALFELQERDPASFPSLPGHSTGRINSASPVNLWDKFRKEGRKSASPIQRINTPSPVAMFEGRGPVHGDGMQGQFQDMSLHDNDRADGHGMPNSGKMQLNKEVYQPPHQPSRENAGTPHTNQSPGTPKWHSSNSTLSTSGSNACPSAGNTPSPPAVPMMPSYNAPMPTLPGWIPLYPLVIPITENLTGPVNASATASRDPNGYDLPLSDVSTLRYYYNLGVEYHHRLCLLQMHQWQQQQQQQQQQQSFHPPQDPLSCPIVSQAQQQQQPAMQTSSASNHFSPEGAMSANNNALDDDTEEGMRQRSCTPNGLQGMTVNSIQQPTLSPSGVKQHGTLCPNGVRQPVLHQQQQQQQQQQQHQQRQQQRQPFLPLPVNAVYFTFPPRDVGFSLGSTEPSNSLPGHEQREQNGRQSPRNAPLRCMNGQPMQQHHQQQQNTDNRVVSEFKPDTEANARSKPASFVTPMRPSMPLRIPTPRSEDRSVNNTPSHIPGSQSPSSCLPACPLEIQASSGPAPRNLVTPTRRKSPFDIVSPGVFPMSPFPVLNNTNITLQPPVLSQTGPTQPYYIDSQANQHIPQQQQQMQAPAPVSTFFSPHANPPAIQSEPYPHMNYHPAPPPPPPPPGNLGTYQYPVQGQWQPAFPYGSPVKVPTVAYGQSPSVTFMTSNAPSSAPALYMPTSH